MCYIRKKIKNLCGSQFKSRIDRTFTDLHKNVINKKIKSAKVLCNKLQSQN